jgi:hypothetical protein
VTAIGGEASRCTYSQLGWIEHRLTSIPSWLLYWFAAVACGGSAKVLGLVLDCTISRQWQHRDVVLFACAQQLRSYQLCSRMQPNGCSSGAVALFFSITSVCIGTTSQASRGSHHIRLGLTERLLFAHYRVNSM